MKKCVGILLALASCSAPAPEPGSMLNRHGLDNAIWLTDKVISGAQPEGEPAFRELADLGVRTVISVDGGRPDLASAHRNGLRYVHLPIGYDGIPKERALELAKAIEELPGPIYLHCHHGKHRGPTAAVVACVTAGRMSNGQAVGAMKTLGTGPQYIGLWATAQDARPAGAAALRALKVDYLETAPVPPLAEAMVALDHVFERLELCRKAGWRRPPDHPDVDPPHEALRAREIGLELMRTDEFKSRPEEYRKLMEAMRTASERLETALRASAPADEAFAALRQSCSDCHKPWRNVKPKE